MIDLFLVLFLVLQDWAHGPPKDPAFFPVAVWLQNPANAGKYRDAGINTFVALWNGPNAKQLEQLKAAGMKVVCHQNEFALTRKDDATIIAWMHGDEPDNAQSLPGGKGYGPPIATGKIVADYAKLRAADPTRPVLLNLGQGVAWDNYIGRGVRRNKPEDYPEYLKGCDIASFDIYPAVHDSPEIAGKLWKVPEGVERLRKWGEGKKLVWNCIEASRIDNEKTKPSAAQIRTEVWMSLIHGSTGLIYFVHQFKPNFVEASLLQDAELLAGVTAINQEIHSLAPALNAKSHEGVAVTSESPVAAMAKKADATYVFAVAMRDKGSKATIKVPGLKGTAEVIGENRSVTVVDGAIADDFKPFEVHLYRVR